MAPVGIAVNARRSAIELIAAFAAARSAAASRQDADG
jgi:hypothetical protein